MKKSDIALIFAFILFLAAVWIEFDRHKTQQNEQKSRAAVEKMRNDADYNVKVRNSSQNSISEPEMKKYKEAIDYADAYTTVGDRQKAVPYLEEAVKIVPENLDTLYRLATSQSEAKQYEKAEKTFAKIAEFDSLSPNFWYFRAENMFKSGKNIENLRTAQKFIDKAYNLYPPKDSLFLLNLRAEIYFEEYKYYQSSSPNSVNAKIYEEKFLKVLSEFGKEAEKQNNPVSATDYNYLREKHRAFLEGRTAKSPYSGELQKIKYSQQDIEDIKNHKRVFPAKTGIK